MKRIAAYCRVSTDEQAEKNISIPAQKSRITSYCHSRGWQVVEYYIDDGYSGKNLDRPAMQKLINDCNQNNFDAVAVWKLDRLSRKQRDALQIIEDVFGLNPESKKIDKKTDLISVTESIDTSTPMGRAQLSIIFTFSQLERETIIERSRFGKLEAAQQGRFGGGGLPYGYDYNPSKNMLIINPVQAEAVKMIYEYYLTGKYGFSAIAKIMTDKGFSGQRTNYMSKDQVKNILTSPFVAGYVKHLTNMFSGQHEAIISKGTWDKTQEMIQRRYTPIPAKDDHNLLTGLIYCEKCGSRMRFKSRIWSSKKTTGNNYYYVCYGRAGYKTMSDHYCSTPYFSAVDINKKVVETLIHYSLNQEELEKFITEKQLKVTNVDINTIKSELANIDKQMDRWLDAFEKGAIDHIILADRTKILNERKIKLEESIADIQKKKDDFEAEIIHANEVLTLLHSLPDIWDKFTIDEKRGLITGIVKKVIVLPDGNVSVKLDI